MTTTPTSRPPAEVASAVETLSRLDRMGALPADEAPAIRALLAYVAEASGRRAEQGVPWSRLPLAVETLRALAASSVETGGGPPSGKGSIDRLPPEYWFPRSPPRARFAIG